jgi:hypothetical protein
LAGQKYIPQYINVDLAPSNLPPDSATFIKNLVYGIDDLASATTALNANEGVSKNMQSVVEYISGFILSEGFSQCIGYLTVKELRQVFVLVYNDQNNHTVYRLNGEDATFDIVDVSPCYNFQLDPVYFIHQGASLLETIYVSDPVTGKIRQRSFLMITDGFNRQWNLAVDDAIATNGFDKTKFPYFNGDYDPCVLRSMGVPAPTDCIKITEIPRTEADKGLNNTLLFNTWQFRILYIDVWGRPSEHGIISDMYIPGVNDCIGSNSGIPRCVNLTFNAPNPTIDKIQVEYRNCNDSQWYLSDTLFLYDGSPLGDWWLRPRNTTFQDGTFLYDPNEHTITYTFCRDRECQPLPTTETARNENPQPRTSVAIEDIGNAISLWNNKEGFAPLSQDLLNKITVTVEPPEKVQINTATITIYIPIYNVGLDNYQIVTPLVAGGSQGYIWGDNNPKHGGAKAYSQYFTNLQQTGFGGYLVGTGNYTISTQWFLDANDNLIEDTAHVGYTGAPGKPSFQKFVFTNVPRGNYVFRLFSHLADPATNQSYTATSTTVWGLCPFNGTTFQVSPQARIDNQELLINACDGDYNTLNDTKILVIADLAYYNGSFLNNQSSRATSGYWYETYANGVLEFPIELVRVTNPVGITSLITDHNGFYWFVTKGTDRSFAFNLQYKCTEIQYNIVDTPRGAMTFSDFIADELFFENGVGFVADYSTTPCNRVEIKGRVFLTGSGIPVSNAVVILTRGQFAVTDSNGEYTILAHDDNYAQPRQDNIVLSSGACAYTNFDGTCIPVKPVVFYKCTNCVVREVDITDYILDFFSGRGLLSGGTYGVAIIAKDWLDRGTDAEPLGYIKIPSIIDSQTISPSRVRVDIATDAIFPIDFDHFTLALTSETTIEQYVDWIVDKVDFVDNTGEVNNIAPTQIKIYYASLLEYQKQNNYNTTVQWNFLETPVGTSAATPFAHDVVYFYLNGDGKYFSTSISALVKYDQVGQYFLIDYTSDLAGLLPNALIRLVRPKTCSGTEGYYELCSTVNLVNQSPELFTFYLNAFDTYYLYRQIPVPVFVNPTNTQTVSVTAKQVANPDGSQTTVTSTTNDTITQINEPRSFGFPFESDSPSNVWGKGCHNIGRPYAKNPFEAILYQQETCALSGAISENGVLNFLNYFDDAKKTDFSQTDINGVVSVIVDSNRVLVVGQDNNFIVGYGDNIVRVNDLGQAIAPSINNQFGNPETQVSGNYGCKLFDKNTIAYYKGFVLYLDSNESSIIINDYKESKPFSESGADSYIRMKIKEVQDWNNKNGRFRYFVGCGNPINNDYIFTDNVIRSQIFVNELNNFDVTAQETVSFGIFNKKFKATWGFVPEYYAFLEGDIKNKQLFSFKNGIPYRHYDASGNSGYGVVYGTTVRRIFTIVVSMDKLKKKKYQSIAVYCDYGNYYVSNIVTETGQQSRILLSQFLEAEFGYYAPFLCDLNTDADPNRPDATGPNALMDGDMLNGTWAQITFMGDPAFDTQFTQLEGVVINMEASEKSGV